MLTKHREQTLAKQPLSGLCCRPPAVALTLQVQALVDVNDEAELHITLLHALHSLIDIVNVDHLQT